jgi:hypothetical protein
MEDAFKALKESNFQLGLLYQVKLIIEGEIKTLHDKQKPLQFLTIKLELQKILKGILHTLKGRGGKCSHENTGKDKSH